MMNIMIYMIKVYLDIFKTRYFITYPFINFFSSNFFFYFFIYYYVIFVKRQGISWEFSFSPHIYYDIFVVKVNCMTYSYLNYVGLSIDDQRTLQKQGQEWGSPIPAGFRLQSHSSLFHNMETFDRSNINVIFEKNFPVLSEK